jgi:alanyl-tRNA synthetase
MGDVFPELRQKQKQIEDVIRREEESFNKTLDRGIEIFNDEVAASNATRDASQVLSGEIAFKLYDTYGFPKDLTADIARERGLSIDEAGFTLSMDEQQRRSQEASKFGVDLRAGATFDARTLFQGYEGLDADGRVVGLLKDGAPVEMLNPGDRGEVVLDRTPFYAEAGGQVGDAGELSGPGVRFIVDDTQKRGAAHSHIGRVAEGTIKMGATLGAHVNGERRRATALNHTATHLLHAALRQVLGTHVQQKGSLVAPDRLRFDFSHFQPVTAEEVRGIERLVNREIRLNTAAETRQMDYDSAVAAGAMALFGEKYDKDVRVLRIGDFSMELCGGTHVQRAGDIGLFKIVSEGGVAAGVRRIEAVTGEGALDYVEQNDALVKDVAGLVRGSRETVRDKVKDALERIRQMEREIRTLKDRLASGQGVDLAASAVDINGVKVVATTVAGADAGALRTAVDQLKERLKSAVVVLASVENPAKVLIVAGVTADQTSRVRAGELVGAIAAQVGGKGGGRPEFAQAGGNNPQALEGALAQVQEFVRARMA